jgi:hypothetical protein
VMIHSQLMTIFGFSVNPAILMLYEYRRNFNDIS